MAVTRVRIGGVTLRLRHRKGLGAARLPAAYAPFSPPRGGDIRLDLVEAPVPVPDEGRRLFESGGTWSAYALGSRILYVFRRPLGAGPPARGLFVNRPRNRGRLFLAPSHYSRRVGFALSFPLDELLFQHHLAHRGALVVHGCGILEEGRAAVFCGHSGVGKTTTARLWRRWSRTARVLSDDRVVLVPRGRGFQAHGTPWHGSGRFAAPEGAPLAALFFLKQAPRTRVTRLEGPNLVSRLFPLTFPPPWEATGLGAALATCERVVQTVPCYTLAFRRDRSAVEAARETLLTDGATKHRSGIRGSTVGGPPLRRS